MPRVKVLLVSPDPQTREMLRIAVGSIERRAEGVTTYLEAENGEQGIAVALREAPDVVVADETASRAGAFALAKELRGSGTPFEGAIFVLLDRPHDEWLARWSGADAWFVKPIDPFELAEAAADFLAEKEGA